MNSKKRKQQSIMFLFALMLAFVFGATMKVTAEAASEKDVVTLNASEIKNWEVGKEGPFKVYVNGVQVDRTTMTWSSSNTAVATCVNGKLVGKSVGTTTISCTKENGTTATCKVTVISGKDVVTLNSSEIKNWEVGQSGPFKVYVNGVQVDRTTMTWNSSNPSVATCVNGKLVGKSVGTTTITCTKTNGTTASCKVTVVSGKDVVTLNTSEIKNWEVGQSGPFKVYVNGVQVDRTTMTWNSSNPSVATCVNGKLVGKSVGTTTITCTKTNGTTASCKVTVVSGKDVVTLNSTEIKNWEVGQSGPFKVYVNGVQVDRTTMTWNSSNPAVATCVNGKLVGKSAGTTTITCTKTNGTTASCKVTVVKGKDVVTLNAVEIKNWEVGQSGTFKVYVNGVQTDRTTMVWSSSNEAVATCVNGRLVGKSAGTATITCTKTNGTVASCKVTVKDTDSFTVYTTTGPENTTFKITVNKNGQMGEQQIYDAKGNLLGVNTVKYSTNGRISRIDCMDAAGNSLGYIDSSYNAADRSEFVMCHALKGDLVAAITAEIDNGKNLDCFFVQAEAGEKKYYQFLSIEGERIYSAYSLWGTTEDGNEVERVYDASGVYRLYVYYFYDESNRLIKVECFSATGIPSGYRIVEYLEDGYIKYTYYGSSGEIHSVTVCDKDGIMWSRSNYTGNVMMSVDTFEYHENGNLKQELSIHYNSNGSVSLKTESVYDERENQLRYTSYRTNDTKYFEGTYEYYENKQLKGSVEIYYSSGGKKENEERYEYYADGNKKSFLVINYDSNGEISFKHEELYNENGDLLSVTGWNENGYKLYGDLYEYRENGTLKRVIQIGYDNGKEAGKSESLYNESEQKVSVVSYNADGTRHGMSLYEYYDSGEEKSRKDYYYNDDNEVYDIWLYVYDKDEKLLKEIAYTADEKKNSEETYEYYENGKVKTKESIGYDITDGSVTSKLEIVYDEKGNEISRVNYTGESTKYFERFCEYYENGKIKYKLCNYYDDEGELEYYYYARYDESGNIIESDTVYPETA